MKTSNEFKVGKNGITYVSSNFQEYFADMDLPPSKEVLTGKTLGRNMTDAEIEKEFGPMEVSLGELLRTLQKGTLLKNGYANIFYVKDANSVLRTLYVRWDSGGWVVDAYALDDYQWCDGGRAFSRKVPVDALTPSFSHTLVLEVGGKRYEIQAKLIS